MIYFNNPASTVNITILTNNYVAQTAGAQKSRTLSLAPEGTCTFLTPLATPLLAKLSKRKRHLANNFGIFDVNNDDSFVAILEKFAGFW